jgi:large subunit ribosomal protein L15
MSNLPKIKAKSKKRVGRGMGSGKGSHTSSRGQKGQKSRGTIGVLFEGMKMRKSFLKRLPLMRGKGKFHAKAQPEIVNYARLEKLADGTEITLEGLIKLGVADPKLARLNGVKILSVGKNPKKFKFSVPTSGKGGSEVAPEKEVKASK